MEGLDQAINAFSAEVAPASKPRDQAGRFVQTTDKPEPMFGERETEPGDDAGPDPELLARERKVADGREDDDEQQADEGPGGKAAKDGEHEDDKGEQKPDEEGQDGELYEVLIDNQPQKVSLSDMAKGYVDGQTYNTRMTQLAEAAKNVQGFAGQIAQHRDTLIQRLQTHEQEYQALIPQEPNWDDLFKQNPEGARQAQKAFQDAYGRLNGMRAERQRLEQEAAQQAEAARAQYADQGFRIFTQRAGLKDNATINNELTAMQRAAAEAGFTPQEISEVYDPRMLEVLHGYSQWKRAQANRPRPVQPESGRTLSPGAARPVSRNANSAARKGIDDALKAQRSSGGKMDETTAVFASLLGRNR